MSQSIDQILADAVSRGDVRGVVATAGTAQGVSYIGASGVRSEAGDAMTPDSVCWIASMTKAITSACALQLVDEGKLTLDAPIGGVLPQLQDPQVLTGFDGDGAPQLRPAVRAITLRHLLTHTSGHAYDMWREDMVRYMAYAGTPGILTCENAALETPLVADPGDAWEYGTGIDWAGKAIEAVSGQRLADYMRDRILAPLGMHDTAFRIGDAQRARLVAMAVRGEDGGLSSIPLEVEQEPEFHMGGGGLYGTAPDYLRFCCMILNGGTLDGVRVLSEATVAHMSRDAIHPIRVKRLPTAVPFATNDAEFFPGHDKGWSLGFMLNTHDVDGGRSADSMNWAGLANTYYWIDPKRGVAGVLMTQILPFADARVLALLDRFEQAVYADAPLARAA